MFLGWEDVPRLPRFAGSQLPKFGESEGRVYISYCLAVPDNVCNNRSFYSEFYRCLYILREDPSAVIEATAITNQNAMLDV